VVSFGASYSNYVSATFPLSSSDPSLIALFWDDHYIRRSGSVFYRFSQEQSLLDVLSARVSAAFDTPFIPSTLFITTWDQVRRSRRTTMVVSAAMVAEFSIVSVAEVSILSAVVTVPVVATVAAVVAALVALEVAVMSTLVTAEVMMEPERKNKTASLKMF